jgi:hypothetical protein
MVPKLHRVNGASPAAPILRRIRGWTIVLIFPWTSFGEIGPGFLLFVAHHVVACTMSATGSRRKDTVSQSCRHSVLCEPAQPGLLPCGLPRPVKMHTPSHLAGLRHRSFGQAFQTQDETFGPGGSKYSWRSQCTFFFVPLRSQLVAFPRNLSAYPAAAFLQSMGCPKKSCNFGDILRASATASSLSPPGFMPLLLFVPLYASCSLSREVSTHMHTRTSDQQ